MPARRLTPWLICYDIADPKRLQRVHKSVVRATEPFQYSVYRTNTTRQGIVEVLNGLERLIDKTRDDVRAYPLLTTATPAVYGRPRMPNGVLVANGQEQMFVVEDDGFR